MYPIGSSLTNHSGAQMSNFIVRASSDEAKNDQRKQELNALVNELARSPGLRDLGWSISSRPVYMESPGIQTLSVGDWHSNTMIQVDKSIKEKTDRALTKMGWTRSLSGQNRKWAYQKTTGDYTVCLVLSWSLASPLRTETHPMGKMQYPIQHMELYIDSSSLR